jgi:hypothetical protein
MKKDSYKTPKINRFNALKKGATCLLLGAWMWTGNFAKAAPNTYITSEGFHLEMNKGKAAIKQVNIAGFVKDMKDQPVDLATIRLIKVDQLEKQESEEPAKENVINSTYSDLDGSFSFTEVKEGIYQVSVSLLGHGTEYSDYIIINAETKAVPPVNFKLNMQSNQIEAVTITAERPLIERRPDMLVVNVDQSPTAAGNTAFEILQRSPGVTVDKDDNLSLMGKEGVQVMIDGKLSRLSSAQLADFLRNMEGSNIRSIELITSPSSKYDAAGSAGIINIVLKKNRLEGTTGSVSVTTGYGIGRKSNAAITLGHKTEKVNLYGNFSHMNNVGGQDIDIDRLVNIGDKNTQMLQSNVLSRISRPINYRAGADVQTSERNTLSLLITGYGSNDNHLNVGSTAINSINLGLDSTLFTSSKRDYQYNGYGANLNNQFKINENGRKLILDFDASRYKSNAQMDYNDAFTGPNGEAKGDPIITRAFTPTIIEIITSKVDYTHPITESSIIETGFKHSWVESDNDMRNERYINNAWNLDPTRSNHYMYNEHIAAAYLVYKDKIGKLGYQAGLRAEYTLNNGYSKTLNSRVKTDYIDLFPTLYLNYSINDDNQANISYSKRLNRPNYQLLNPFKDYLDQFTYKAGNPYLTPEYAHMFDASYTFKNKYHLSLGYQLKNDVIIETMTQEEGSQVAFITNENLARQHTYYGNLNIPIKITRNWNMNTNINGFYLGFEGTISHSQYNAGKLGINFRNNHHFKLSENFNAEATLNYQSPLVYSLYNIDGQWGIDLGASYSVLNKKGTIRLSATDIFDTKQHDIRINHGNVKMLIDQKHETRVFRLSFTYSFGNMKNRVQARESSSEEKSRISMP